MEECLKTKRVLKSKISRLVTLIESQVLTSSDERDIYVGKISELEIMSNNLFLNISKVCEEEQFDVYEEEFNNLDVKLHGLKLKLCQFNMLATVTSHPQGGARAELKLPRISLPIFSGEFEQWISFHDLFMASVHNNASLSNAQKLQYLKVSVKGEALGLIQSFVITDANYNEAWSVLVNRYQNTREIISAHLERLLHQTPMSNGSAVALRKIVDVTNECVRSIRVHEAPIEHWDVILVHVITRFLDVTTRREWELSLHKDEMPTFFQLMQFLDTRAHALASATSNKSGVSGKAVKQLMVHHGGLPVTCHRCKGDHNLSSCKEFQKLDVKTRRNDVQRYKLCFNCLHKGHQAHQCKFGKCHKCHKLHHTLLHEDATSSVASHEEVKEEVGVENYFCQHYSKNLVLLATALIRMQGADGSSHIVRALLDSGSQATFITENCMQQLGLQKHRIAIPIFGIGGKHSQASHGWVKVTMQSIHEEAYTYELDALVLSRISNLQPGESIQVGKWSHLESLKLADPLYHLADKVDVLLGADVYAELMLGGVCRGPLGTPIAVQTTLGWVLSGKLISNIRSSILAHHVILQDDQTINQFWDLEVDQSRQFFTPEEKLCEEHFQNTHKRDSQGRFVLQLPFRKDQVDLGGSKKQAIQRLKQMENRMRNDQDLKGQYKEFMSEYLSLGHMESVHSSERDKAVGEVNYLPHHAVLKPDSTTTKLRVVFDASAKSTNGKSLNDNLMVGPTVQGSLWSILLRFHEHIVALSADIKKMYRQICISPPHTDFLRILWRDSPQEEINEYRLLTVTYGTSAAPYQATKCLQQLALDERQRWPLASMILERDFYVDDLLSGAKSEVDAMKLQQELIQLLAAGGFQLCKWSSNSYKVLQNVSEEYRETKLPLQVVNGQKIKALGVYWDPGTDQFLFKIPKDQNKSITTKRSILSEASKTYDPLGFVSPVTFQAKLLFQTLWKLNLDWDEEIPFLYSEQWEKYKQDILKLNEVRVPRCILESEATQIQIHAFCDASEKGYSAVVYFRWISPTEQAKVAFVTSKCRVAPVKCQSLPRLELCAAVLLAQLVTLVKKAVTIMFEQAHAYTDSTIVLAWLSSSPSRWKTFVANRVCTIQEANKEMQWHHIASEQNPADCGSRGMRAERLITQNLWWSGPTFLWEKELNTEIMVPQVSNKLIDMEEKHLVQVLLVQSDNYILQRFSSLKLLKHVIAWCHRFWSNCKIERSQRKCGALSMLELQEALNIWVRKVQLEEFQLELLQLKRGLGVHNQSKLKTLNPFIDSKGIIRVGGRLSKSQLPEEKKHPVVLPHHHPFTTLVIEQEHLETLHAGPQHVLSSLQQRYWILKGRQAVRAVTRKCVTCRRSKPMLAQQLMGDLPSSRVKPSPPFSHCGIDYAGPITLRLGNSRCRRTCKGYIAIFVCFATKAVHIELVSDLTTAAFLASLKRFIACRGRPLRIVTDCGSNFLGAASQVTHPKLSSKGLTSGMEVMNYLADKGIEWKFNPPATPHFGGLWEAAVKSMKYHLKRIVGIATLNFEEMITVLTQIEAVLNSRPLTQVSDDPSDFNVLTPGHFLIGRPMSAMPEMDFTAQKVNRLSRWQYCQRLIQHFWNRWNDEYLTSLQHRYKWWRKTENLKVGTLVLIKNETMPPLKWKRGRVIETHVGADGLVRAVTVQTAHGQIIRPIVKLAPLLTPDEEE